MKSSYAIDAAFGEAAGRAQEFTPQSSSFRPDFLTARTHLFSKPYGWLVTNSRLGAYNGLHLVHLAGTSRLPIRFVVYADRQDLWLAREAQRVGAFYESRDRVDRALPAYLRSALPPLDRREPAEADRARRLPRQPAVRGLLVRRVVRVMSRPRPRDNVTSHRIQGLA